MLLECRPTGAILCQWPAYLCVDTRVGAGTGSGSTALPAKAVGSANRIAQTSSGAVAAQRGGRHFKVETHYKTHWTLPHYAWLDRTLGAASGSFKVNLSLLLRQLKSLNAVLAEYDEQVDQLAHTPRYEKPVLALTCYKGIKNLFALTMITEIGDVKRFPHPRQLASWIGMDIREYSSGGKHNRFGITRQGNRFLRTAFVEANQRGYRTAKISQRLRARRKNTDMELVNIADRCMKRLNQKGNRSLLAGKHPNKVKVACAREMVGFVWESLQKVAA